MSATASLFISVLILGVGAFGLVGFGLWLRARDANINSRRRRN